jgi:hypothetical protein
VSEVSEEAQSSHFEGTDFPHLLAHLNDVIEFLEGAPYDFTNEQRHILYHAKRLRASIQRDERDLA